MRVLFGKLSIEGASYWDIGLSPKFGGFFITPKHPLVDDVAITMTSREFLCGILRFAFLQRTAFLVCAGK